jgi:hypothetical protein
MKRVIAARMNKIDRDRTTPKMTFEVVVVEWLGMTLTV